ncbi:hypothetical protein ABEV77_16130 [Bacillus subtilis]|uniref:hypothetical protein n=1 Tax=Bacillus subtilis group TaxID=653685 RepID=UPI00164F522A|nr:MULTISPECIES: hypothetical protein [Bacillus subtilis group]WGE39880.1 hypothetical protein QA442_04910 [Bacillus stercoris]
MKKENCECKATEQGKFGRVKTIGTWTYRIVAGFKTLSWLYGWIVGTVLPFFHHLN